MSMNHSGNSANKVSMDFIKTQCPEEFKALEQILIEAGIDFNDFFVAQYFDKDYDNIVADDFDEQIIDKAYDALKETFIIKTGLGLYSVYHDAEEKGDELNGGAFAVDGVYGLTEAGKRFKDEITEITWTTFG